MTASFYTDFPRIFQWTRWASHVNESLMSWSSIRTSRCPRNLFYLAFKILQGADGITKIKAGHPPQILRNAAPETKKIRKNRLPRYSWLSEIVCKQSLKGCQSNLSIDEMNFEINIWSSVLSQLKAYHSARKCILIFFGGGWLRKELVKIWNGAL